MIHIKRKVFEEIPVLEVIEAEKTSQALPTVVYYHGFRGEKESSLTIAYKLATKGIRVILPDSPKHGERKGNYTSTELDLAFWDIVIDNIEEMGKIKTYLEKEQLMIPGKIGIGGTSMGGITTFGALKKYDWIKVAVVLMGAPNMSEFAQHLIDVFNHSNHEEQITEQLAEEVKKRLEPYDLAKEPERLQNRPLYIWHGEQDQVVSPAFSEKFYKKIKEQFKMDSQQFYLEKNRAHHISRLAIEETTRWFTEHLL